ncbi:MAG: GTPase Era [Gammaproteobacteria bacterium]|nr:GTPase Era [Gammaproteobacteria bacterium]|tara:strand:- start:346 stop:1254 length:909 start_codon:yes stop_codon:yes gene_type:complete
MKKQFCGHISIVGKPNVGKSTLLNTILNKKISITSRKSQTTRNNILGVKTDNEFQMIFLDTPGIHMKATKTLNKVLNHSALTVIEDSDLVLFVIHRKSLQSQDIEVLRKIKDVQVPAICVINKIDQVKNKNDLLPLIQEIDAIYSFNDYVPVSALNNDGVQELLGCIKKSLPQNHHLYPAEIKEKEIPDNFFISELVREKIIRSLGDELPHETYVDVETKTMEEKMLSIGVIIYVARNSQKSIVIGHEGSNLKRIGKQTRLELEKMIHKKVLLKTFVKVNKNWNNDAQHLSSLGVGSNQDVT